MDSNKTSCVMIEDTKVDHYFWNFDLPPRSKIQSNLENVAVGGFPFAGLQFPYGILGKVEHRWGITFYANQINVQFMLPLRDQHNRYCLKSSCLKFYSNKQQLQGTAILHFNRTTNSVIPVWNANWRNLPSLVWDDTIDRISIFFEISCESAGKCVTFPVKVEPKLDAPNTGEYFMDEHLSDVTFDCQGTKFPGHHVFFSSRNPTFTKLIQTEMKDGVVVIHGVRPSVFRMLLEFLYCGSVTGLGRLSRTLLQELLEAAHKFNVDALKVQCELELTRNIELSNVVDLYNWAQSFDAPMLKDVCWSTILRNKNILVRNRDDFDRWLRVYPDFVHAMFLAT